MNEILIFYNFLWCQALSNSKMVLTSTDLLLTEIEEFSKNDGQIENHELQQTNNEGQFVELSSKEVGVFLLELLDPREILVNLKRSQRWAIKQDSPKSIGEWRNSKLATPEWHKLALTWPVDEDEKLIESFKWPINGALIPGAPPLRDVDKVSESANIRFRVIKNGTLVTDSGLKGDEPIPGIAYVCKLDSKKLLKDYIHCGKTKYREFEFIIFLDSCTQALNLTSAARRLFTHQVGFHAQFFSLIWGRI